MPEENEKFKIPEKVTKEEFEKFTPFEKNLFVLEGDVYVPNFEKKEDIKALKSEKDRQISEKNKIKAEKEAIEKKLKEIEEKEKQSNVVIDDYKKDITQLRQELKDKEEKAKRRTEKILIEKTASEIASLFKSDKVGVPFAKNRLSIEYDDQGEPVTVFHDDLGNKITRFSEIKQIILADDELKPTLKGIESSGGGASAHNTHRSIPSVSDLKTAKAEDLVAIANADPDAFLKLLEKSK
jgi:hypothetical protein